MQPFTRDKKEYDGTTVADALDYYFPEWRHVDGRLKILAQGNTADGYHFFIFIPRDRSYVERYVWCVSTERVALEDEKEKLFFLSRGGDSHSEETDKRYLVMVRDNT